MHRDFSGLRYWWQERVASGAVEWRNEALLWADEDEQQAEAPQQQLLRRSQRLQAGPSRPGAVGNAGVFRGASSAAGGGLSNLLAGHGASDNFPSALSQVLPYFVEVEFRSPVDAGWNGHSAHKRYKGTGAVVGEMSRNNRLIILTDCARQLRQTLGSYEVLFGHQHWLPAQSEFLDPLQGRFLLLSVWTRSGPGLGLIVIKNPTDFHQVLSK